MKTPASIQRCPYCRDLFVSLNQRTQKHCSRPCAAEMRMRAHALNRQEKAHAS